MATQSDGAFMPIFEFDAVRLTLLAIVHISSLYKIKIRFLIEFNKVNRFSYNVHLSVDRNLTCESDWIQFGDKCYWASNGPGLKDSKEDTMTTRRYDPAVCTAKNATMLVVRNKQNVHVFSFLSICIDQNQVNNQTSQ